MTDRSDLNDTSATPRARRIAKELGAELPPSDQRLNAANVLSRAGNIGPAVEEAMEFRIEILNARRLVDELAPNTLRGEATPTIGDVFIKAVIAAAEMHALRSAGEGLFGLYQMRTKNWAHAPNLGEKHLREIASLSAHLATGGLGDGGEIPTLLIADSLRWELSDLRLDLPPTATMLLTLAAHPDDDSATIRVQVRKPPLTSETAYAVGQTLVELMTTADWSIH